jgi:hypothetical protein
VLLVIVAFFEPFFSSHRERRWWSRGVFFCPARLMLQIAITIAAERQRRAQIQCDNGKLIARWRNGSERRNWKGWRRASQMSFPSISWTIFYQSTDAWAHRGWGKSWERKIIAFCLMNFLRLWLLPHSSSCWWKFKPCLRCDGGGLRRAFRSNSLAPTAIKRPINSRDGCRFALITDSGRMDS